MYKVLIEKNEKPIFLFHGVKGTRSIPFDKWIKAENKTVRDGTKGTLYVSGFHVFPNHKAIQDWTRSLSNFENRYIVKVKIKKTRPKSHSIHDVILADHMIVTEEAWKNRKPLKKNSL
jgi:hypothetical protein